MNYLQGNIFTNIDETISFIVELGEYLLEFIDKSCGKILVESFISEFAIIMDISSSMENLVNKYINIVIPGIFTNLNY